MVIGAVIRVFAIPGVTVFRLLVAALLLPLGLWLIGRTLRPARPARAAEPSPRDITGLAFVVGVVGGIYGIGGGSILGPILVPRLQVCPEVAADQSTEAAGRTELPVGGDVTGARQGQQRDSSPSRR